MINIKITNKIMSKKFQHNFYRYLSVQKNINKSCYHHKIYFSNKNENRSTCYPFSKTISQKLLCQSPGLFHMNIHRNLSTEPKGDDDLLPLENLENSETMLTDIFKNFGDKLVKGAQEVILEVHEFSGLPWWASIALTAFVVRTFITLPYSIYQLRNKAKLKLVEYEVEDFKKICRIDAIKAKQKYGMPDDYVDEKLEKAVSEKWSNLVRIDKCYPAKVYVPTYIQSATWFTMSFVIYKMSTPTDVSTGAIYTQLTTGGFGWITDLTIEDPYFILPITYGLINLAVIKVHMLFALPETVKEKEVDITLARLTTGTLLLVSTLLPTAVNIYWISSSFYSFLQAFLLNSRTVQKVFKVPALPRLERPYKVFVENAKPQLRITAK